MKKKVLELLVVLFMIAVLPNSPAFAATRTTLPGSVPSWAKSANFVAAANPTSIVGFRVYLGWRNSAGATALAQAVSDPRSSSYGHYLTPSQFRQQYAPSAAAAGAVQSWLKSEGFSIVYTPANNHYVSAQGTIARAETAFGAPFGMYKVRGLTVRSPAHDISIPSSLAGIVSAVVGLDDSAVFVSTDHVVDGKAPPTAGFVNAPPMSNYWDELTSPYTAPTGFTDLGTSVPWTIKGYTPAQIKGAYGISSTFTGAGQTVAIIDAYASPTIVQDVNQWSTNRGLPTLTSGQLVQVVPPGIYNMPNNPAQSPSGWYGEETLDIEAVHGMATAAKIVYVGAPNNYRDLDAALNHVVDMHLAQIVSNSYGYSTELLPRGYVKPVEDTLIQAAIEGIGVYFSTGDNGDETSRFGFATPDWPAVSPWVTSVGGTSLGISQANARAVETGWGTSTYSCNSTTLVCTRKGWLYGAGGGVSQLFGVPFYQKGMGFSGRAEPDIAALADPQTGYLIGQTQSFPTGPAYGEYRIGGTSLASPIMAGLMALADEAAGHPHGFANPLFYENPGAFYDVLSVKTAVARRNYNNSINASNGTSDFLRTFDDYAGSPTQHTGTGWDNVTGLGTPTSSFLSTFGH